MAKRKSPWHGKGKNRWRRITLRRAPAGSYDLGLDQAEAASRRGLRDLVGDINPYVPGSKRPAGTESLRAIEDVNLARTENARQRGYLDQDYGLGVKDVERGYGRTMQDLLGQRQTLDRNYAQLANQQRQNFEASGLADGGAALQAAQKRTANKAFELAPIQIAETRTGEDRSTSLSDLLRQQQRGTTQLNSSLGEVNLTYGRGVQDRTTQLVRARREANQYRRDLNQTRMQQYLQGGGKRKMKVGVKRYRKLRKQGAV